MRQFKFRFWNTINGYFEDDLTKASAYYQDPFSRSDIIVNQWTGLLDSNGVWIYDGDILAHTSWIQNKKHGCPKDDFSGRQLIEGVLININKNPYPIYMGFENDPYRIVEYISHDMFYEATAYFSPFVDGCAPEEYEVVGNIYENPELLQEKK